VGRVGAAVRGDPPHPRNLPGSAGGRWAFIKLPGPEHFPMNDVGVLAAISVPLGFTRGVDRVQAGPDKIA
jgi:hypothetical protein